MKFFTRIFVIISLTILTCATSFGQESYIYKRGGFVFAGTGASYGNITDLDFILQDNDLICMHCSTPQISLNVGGGGGGLIGKRFIIEGKGYGQLFEVTESENTIINLTGLNVLMGFGVAVVNKNGWLLYPAVLGGWSDFRMKLKNKTDNTLFLGDSKLYPQSRTDFRMNAAMLELKFGMNKVVTHKGRGLAIGFDIGVHFDLTRPEWQNMELNQTVNGIPETGYAGIFGNLTIGFGSFKKGQNGKKAKMQKEAVQDTAPSEPPSEEQ